MPTGGAIQFSPRARDPHLHECVCVDAGVIIAVGCYAAMVLAMSLVLFPAQRQGIAITAACVFVWFAFLLAGICIATRTRSEPLPV